MKPNEKVPSVRALAEELSVAKKTVELAYEILQNEGYFKSYGPKGTRVNPDLYLPLEKPMKHNGDNLFAKRADLTDPDGFFRLGIPALDSFPIRNWQSCIQKVSREFSTRNFDYPNMNGEECLRSSISQYLNLSRGVHCQKEQVIITNGHFSSLRLIFENIVNKNKSILLEEPNFFLGRNFIKEIHKKISYIPVDDNGLDTDYLAKKYSKAQLALITPNHHSPLCHSLSLPRRQALLNWAHQGQSWIIEDDYDGEFHYTKKQIPALKSMDGHDRVIYMGTFSKTIMPSLRVSYIVIPKQLVSKFNSAFNQVPSVQIQRTISLFMDKGFFLKHLKKMRLLYKARRQFVIEAINEQFPNEFLFDPADGGMHIVAYLKKNLDDQKIAKEWQKENLLVSPLSQWYEGIATKKGLVIGFTNIKSKNEALMLLKKLKKNK